MKILSFLLILPMTMFLPTGVSLIQRGPDAPHASASLPCGIMNPHSQYLVTADTGANKSGGLDKFEPPVANTTLVQNTGDGYPFNGGGVGNASVRTLCLLVFPGDEHNVYTSLNITTAVLAGSGCCGGLQPGGQAYAQPEWQSSLVLPDTDDKDKPWTLKATLNTNVNVDDPGLPKPSGRCILSIDGNATGHELDQTSPSASFSERISAGPHSIKFQCPQYGLNVRGAGRVFQRNASIDQTLFLSAQRVGNNQAPTTQPK